MVDAFGGENPFSLKFNSSRSFVPAPQHHVSVHHAGLGLCGTCYTYDARMCTLTRMSDVFACACISLTSMMLKSWTVWAGISNAVFEKLSQNNTSSTPSTSIHHSLKILKLICSLSLGDSSELSCYRTLLQSFQFLSRSEVINHERIPIWPKTSYFREVFLQVSTRIS